MNVFVKRIYEPVAQSDGYRVLVDRLWPRGVIKANAKLDVWIKDIGPSTALRKWFGHDPERWDEFQSRYHAELREKTALLETITQQAKLGPVTLLYSATDEQHNQAVALRSFLMKRPAKTRSTEQRKTQPHTISKK
jgi:uncharacterized protein YeaO (DUF488 family)